VIVGGMLLGTLLTIFVVPTMYTLFARRRIPGANKAELVEPVRGATAEPAVARPTHSL
jgi:multidrug efflux pump